VPSHAVDSVLFRDLFGSEEMRAVFSDEALVQRWLDVEAALARAQAQVGLIPAEAAAQISSAARVANIDLEALGRDIMATVHPIVPLVRALERACAGDAGRYIHWGATTQDIMDTAVALQLGNVFDVCERQLGELGAALAVLTERFRKTPMAGRTHGQHAVPITFGFKTAVWLAEVDRHLERLAQARPRVLVGQFSGAVGSLASVGARGTEVQELMMAELGLRVPPIAWHTSRDGLAELACLLALVGGTVAKVANEVVALQKTEILELQEPWHHGKVGSSTMPHKRNPMLSEAVVGMSKIARAGASLMLELTVQEHERDMRPWHAEWEALPELCIVTSGSLATVTRVVRGLEVDPARMASNLAATNGLILSERVMMELAPLLGRERAHDLVYEASMTAFEQKQPLADVLLADPELATRLSRRELEGLLDPAGYTGLCAEFCDRVLELWRRRAGAD
jgi:3-carboxy-cis,cis-muconate cycloisomerase